MPLSSFSGVIPPEQSTQIMQEAIIQSAALQLGTRVPMGTNVTNMPVPSVFPVASWVSSAGTGRKPYTNTGLVNKTMTAEEVAAVIAIPDAMIEDSTINLWAFARPLLAQAIAVALDQAILFGINAPATFPAGGVIADAQAQAAVTDAVGTVNHAMGLVETQGLAVSGHAADLGVRAVFRGVRASTGELLLGEQQWQNYTVPTLYGLPINYSSWDATITGGATPYDYLTGAWKYLIIGVRSDLRYDMNPAAVIADSAGVVQVSGWQDNVTPLKVWARFACALVHPPTPRVPAGAKPFAKSQLGLTAGGLAADEPAGRSARK